MSKAMRPFFKPDSQKPGRMSSILIDDRLVMQGSFFFHFQDVSGGCLEIR